MDGCLAEGCLTWLVKGELVEVMSAWLDQAMPAGFQEIAADQVRMKAAGRGRVRRSGQALELM